jgi:hypothetical protein
VDEGGLDAFLDGVGAKPATDSLDALIQADAAPKSAGKARHEAALEASKGELKRANDALQAKLADFEARDRRWLGLVKTLLIILVALMVTNGLTYLYTKTQDRRSLERAFRIIDNRESRFLMGNIMVLQRFGAGLDGIAAKAIGVDGIDDDEKKFRVKTIQTVKVQNAGLIQMYQTRLQEAEADRNRGPQFSYKDPFIKREIDLAETDGGRIDPKTVEDEIAKQYDLEGTFRSLSESMTSPIPLADQLRESSDKRKALEAMKDMIQKQAPLKGGMPALPGAPALGPDAGEGAPQGTYGDAYVPAPYTGQGAPAPAPAPQGKPPRK